MSATRPFPLITAEDAAALIPNGALIGFSGFTPAGAAKVVPRALAARAKALHAAGTPFKIRLLTGASTGAAIDEELSQADAISWRCPYQSSKHLRDQINAQEVQFVDMHISNVPQNLAYGFFGEMEYAVIEATDVTRDGRVYLPTSIGMTPSLLRYAKKIIIEINRFHSPRVSEMSDIVLLPPPPDRDPIPIHTAMSRIGVPYASVDPKKIVGIIEHSEPDDVMGFDTPSAAHRRIAEFVVEFLVNEMRAGRVPREFLPLQSGVGNVANAVLAGLGESPDIPPFEMYTEVFQEACVDLMEKGLMTGASTTGITVSPQSLQHIYENLDFFIPRIILRPMELSNHPGVIRRLGLITMNTALEIDIFGHANSTHVMGTQMMNGIGGSGDFTRNAYLSIYLCQSINKGGRISGIVPMCSHVDHNEHSVQVVVTDQGLADLRGLGANERATTIIEKCAHPMYRDYLHRYLETATMGHLRHDLSRCFEMHQRFMATGSMQE